MFVSDSRFSRCVPLLLHKFFKSAGERLIQRLDLGQYSPLCRFYKKQLAEMLTAFRSMVLSNLYVTRLPLPSKRQRRSLPEHMIQRG